MMVLVMICLVVFTMIKDRIRRLNLRDMRPLYHRTVMVVVMALKSGTRSHCNKDMPGAPSYSAKIVSPTSAASQAVMVEENINASSDTSYKIDSINGA